LPSFRAGNVEKGVVDGTEAIVQQLSLPDDQAKANVAQAVQVQSAQRPSGAPPIGALFVILIVVFVLSGALRGRGGALWLLPLLLSGGGRRGGWGGGDDWGGGGGGGFSGGGGSFGGGGSSGSW
jgi:uncharacterized protein